MPAAEAASAAPPQRKGRGLLWLMLGIIVLLACTAAIAFSGWSAAIRRADAQAARAAAAQATTDEAAGLRTRLAALQSETAAAQDREKAAQAQLADKETALARAQERVAAAEARATSADKAAADAEQARAALQNRLDAEPPAAPTAARGPQPASNTPGAAEAQDLAPGLPKPDLPASATPRDYLVAAQQAVRQGRTGLAQSALEHAETRLLNQRSLARASDRAAFSPGIAEIEQALDQLGSDNTEAALRTIEALLIRY